ncbi:Thrombospondin-2, partial [Trichinella britovi]
LVVWLFIAENAALAMLPLLLLVFIVCCFVSGNGIHGNIRLKLANDESVDELSPLVDDNTTVAAAAASTNYHTFKFHILPERFETFSTNVYGKLLDTDQVDQLSNGQPLFNYTELIDLEVERFVSGKSVAVVMANFTTWKTVLSDKLNIPCQLFDRPGQYQIRLRGKAGDFESNRLTVDHWPAYAVHCRADRLFPCERGGVVVGARTPPHCPAASTLYRVRLFAVRDRRHRPMEVGRRGVYVAERALAAADAVVEFQCALFDLIYPEYCFRLVSVHGDGLVRHLAQRCVPTERKSNMSTDGQWSVWQSWSSCTDTCGERSVKHRLRLCNNPKPAFGGQYCKGSGLETVPCPRLPCPVAEEQPSRLHSDAGHCVCGGCTLTTPGLIVLPRKVSWCENASGLWLLQSTDNTTTIVHFSVDIGRWLSSNQHRWHLWIRDGPNVSSAVLFDSSKNEFGRFSSSRSQVLVQLEPLAPNDVGDGDEREAEPGLIRYTFSTAGSITMGEDQNRLQKKRTVEIGSTAGVSILVLLALAVMVFVSIRNRVTNLLHHFTSLVRNVDKFSTVDPGSGKISKRRRLSDPTVDSRMSQTEMQVSMQTQTTRLSADVAIPFVQPTVQSTSKSATPSGCSFAEPEQDFEYDYYEAPIEGSILNPAWSY